MRTIQKHDLSWRTACRISVTGFLFAVVVGAVAGWKCSSNPGSSPGWATNSAIISMVVGSLFLIVVHRTHARDQWRVWLYPELLSIWLGLGAGFDAAQRIAGADLHQNLLGLAIVVPLFLFVIVALALVVLQMFRRPRGQDECPVCLYSTKGIDGGICPECGRDSTGELSL